MITKTIGRASAAALVLAGLAVVTVPEAQAACRSAITRTADGNIQWTTRLTARNRWRARVRQIHGSGFARWANASNKDENCRKPGPGQKWRCSARARPCN